MRGIFLWFSVLSMVGTLTSPISAALLLVGLLQNSTKRCINTILTVSAADTNVCSLTSPGVALLSAHLATNFLTMWSFTFLYMRWSTSSKSWTNLMSTLGALPFYFLACLLGFEGNYDEDAEASMRLWFIPSFLVPILFLPISVFHILVHVILMALHGRTLREEGVPFVLFVDRQQVYQIMAVLFDSIPSLVISGILFASGYSSWTVVLFAVPSFVSTIKRLGVFLFCDVAPPCITNCSDLCSVCFSDIDEGSHHAGTERNSNKVHDHPQPRQSHANF